MTFFVLDCSMTMAWCFKQEITEETNAIRRCLVEDHLAIVPSLWSLEVMNTLMVSERRNRLSVNDSQSFISFLKELPIELDRGRSILDNSIIFLAREHQLSIYDAAYLELAIRKSFPLATLDSALKNAAHRAGIKIFQPLAA